MLTVCSFRDADALWRGVDAVISVEDIDTENRFRLPDQAGVPAHLILQFDDIDDHDDPAWQPASAAQVYAALAFARNHATKRLLVHCQAGQCRSTGLALAIIAERMGPGREAEAVRKLLELRPIAAPNLVVLAHADALLGRAGALESAWLRHEAGDDLIGRMRTLKKLAYAQDRMP